VSDTPFKGHILFVEDTDPPGSNNKNKKQQQLPVEMMD